MTAEPSPRPAEPGASRRCRTWLAEAALRCLENNLHPDVAEDPDHLVVYGGRGKADADRRSSPLSIIEIPQLIDGVGAR